MCCGAVPLGGDLGDDGVVEDAGDVAVVVCRVCAGERGVGGDVDAMFLVPVDIFGLLEVGVESVGG